MRVLEVHTSNISKSVLRITIVYMMAAYKEFEMLVKATDKNVIFMHTFRIPKSSILMETSECTCPDYSDNDSGEFHYVLI